MIGTFIIIEYENRRQLFLWVHNDYKLDVCVLSGNLKGLVAGFKLRIRDCVTAGVFA
jgi:phenolic acid decarboxylase